MIHKISTIHIMLSLCLCFALFTPGWSAQFTAGPTALQSSGKITITFTVDVSTDVEVAILDKDSNIVRHLAAGVLGGKYAAPLPLQAGLSQSLDWDFTGDQGEAVTGDPFSVRVRLGLKPVFKRKIAIDAAPASLPLGDKYISLQDPVFYPSPAASQYIMEKASTFFDMTVDDLTDNVYLALSDNHTPVDVYNGLTGAHIKQITFPSHYYMGTGEIALPWHGEDWLFYESGWADDSIRRFTRSGAPSAWPGTGVATATSFWGTAGHSLGLSGAADGSLYVLHRKSEPGYGSADGTQDYIISQVGATGTTLRRDFVPIPLSVQAVTGGLKVDNKGNMFIGGQVKVPGEAIPKALDSILPAGNAPNSYRWWAYIGYGSVLKYDNTGKFVWIYYGMFPLFAFWTPTGVEGTGCICKQSRLDVDRFGRVFFGDAFRYTVVILDNNRNEILKYRYKDIPVYFATTVEATDRGMYVADGNEKNRQVACFSLEAEQAATISSTAIEKRPSDKGLRLALEGNYPNPFNPATSIGFSVPGRGQALARLSVYDVNRRLVKVLWNKPVNGPERYVVEWDGKTQSSQKAASGVYYYRLKCGDYVSERKMVLMQ